MKTRWIFVWLLVLVLSMVLVMPAAAKGLTGSFYTTSAGCTAGSVTQFEAAADVYLATARGNGQGGSLPDGSYYVRVTSPDGELLGSSITASVVVTNGAFASCYQLIKLVTKASDGAQGFDLTTVPGGVFKVWLSPDADFALSKTHNFTLQAARATAQAQEKNPSGAPEDDQGDEVDDGSGRGNGQGGWRNQFLQFLEQWRQLFMTHRYGVAA
ncbi:MAG: hypothetical protein LLG44_14905 [Chloroflexi bacterium]|nr:hypothetical protein [Chloroflexota bacterium]